MGAYRILIEASAQLEDQETEILALKRFAERASEVFGPDRPEVTAALQRIRELEKEN